jgi:hypothetical protein
MTAASADAAPNQYRVIDVRVADPATYDLAEGRPGVLADRPAYNGLTESGDFVGGGWTGGYSRPYYFQLGTAEVANLGDTTGDFGDPAVAGLNDSSSAEDINNLGWTVGRTSITSALSSANDRPFFWADADGNGARTITGPNGDEMHELALNPGASYGYARQISDGGQVAIQGDTGIYLAELTYDAGTNALTEVGSRSLLTTDGVSSLALIDGAATWSLQGTGTKAKTWRDANGNGAVDVGEISEIPVQASSKPTTRTYGMAGDVVCGTMQNAFGAAVGFRWTDLDGDNVPDFDDADNDGVFDSGETSAEIARFMADNTAITWFSGNTFARACDAQGTVVGGFTQTGGRRAFVWDDADGGQFLDDLVDPEFPLQIRQAEGINEQGMIVAYGELKDESSSSEHAVLLIPIPDGDATRDGAVDVGDLGILAGQWNQSPTSDPWGEADFNDDGLVDVGDLGILAGNWGTTGLGVPEPATIAVFAISAIVMTRKRNEIL